MSFTEDELRAFNSILEQRLTAHRNDVEQMLDLRIQTLRHDLEQRMTELVNSSLAARLLSIEQLLQQQLARQPSDEAIISVEQMPPFEAIEVQTDLPWDDLLAIFGKVLDERLATLKASIQTMIQEAIRETMQAALKDDEQHPGAYLHVPQHYVQLQSQPSTGNLTQDVFNSIEQLERIIESMQVAMSNNHALLANRLYHHQQLPQERAHPAQPQPPQSLQSSQQPATSNGQVNGADPHVISVEEDGQ